MAGGVGYVQIQTEPSLRQSGGPEPCRIFEELPEATIVSVSRPDAADISPLLLTYTIQLRYKQFKWQLVKKASQVFYLHFKLKKRAFMEEMQERQEQVKEWLQNIGIGELTPSMQDDEEADGEAVSLHHQDESAKDRDVPSSAALPIIRPALGRLQSISGRAKIAMQGYLNHFLGNISIVNSPEVCKFLEVSKLSFSPEYGSKLKEEYVRVMHLPKIPKDDDGGSRRCCMSDCFSCCNDNLQKVWAVLKPGFLALLADPFDVQPLDIIVFDVLPPSDGKGDGHLSLAKEIKERNPLRHSLKVTCGNRSIELRVKSSRKVADWLAAINDAGLRTRERWCQHHRYDSFAPPRGLIEDGSQAQWFVDGQAAFEAIASSIKNAKSERPFQTKASSRLDNLLEEKAKQGVQVYILLYKEVALALKINSFYSKRKLLCIHENVRVLRYPDHFSAGVYLWSHHEKIVIIDHQICFIGGLDLCFGRYDTPEHKVGDSPPLIWPGKDYYNPRESEPNSWEDTMKDELDRGKYPRMPWHDVHCALWGPPCRDIARHFVERWNYAKRNKAPNQQAIPLLMPRHHMVIPHYMGRCIDDTAIERGDSFSLSSQDIPLLLPQESGGLNISVRESKLNRLSSFSHLHDQSNRVSSSLAFSLPKAKMEPSDIAMKGLSGVNYHDKMSLDRVSHVDIQSTATEWWKTPEHPDESRQVGPRASCRCQVIRSVSQWSAGTRKNEESIHNAYCSLIEKAEHFIYIENQFFISGLSGDDIIRNRVSEALYRRIIRAYEDNKLFRVIIVIPLLPGFQGGLDDSGAASVRAIMHWQYRTICRGQNSILHNLFQLLGPRIQDYISFYGLRAYGRLSDNGPVATNQVYVHSKIMIVDDCTCLIGSANINDRSLLGSRDSEIGVIIEDGELIGSYMDGKPWKAGKFSLTLRLSLWSEHLGLRAGEVSRIMDPVVESTYKDIWMATAKTNTTIYHDVFSCVPNDEIHTRFAFRQSVASWKEKNGHTTIDLGIAPKNVEYYHNGGIKKVEALERLASVKGHLVSFPLEFMSLENLRPAFIESEYYATQVFH
ncbi:hypothetical protein TanjilG_29041 [Lupinus angustifolius]|uniref:Phospholipase n=1 Tax=Lupinus angustifolius TaxID=3871 RepID=A0A4P1RSS7_LUPAN|nr:hypothetical protein TanjilG_29041 [Lupinus angustifolius]